MAIAKTAKNQKNSWWLGASAGRFHQGGSPSAMACSAPSIRSNDGGVGSSRPARRLNTGSMIKPSITGPGPATTRWIHIGISPTMPAPISGAAA